MNFRCTSRKISMAVVVVFATAVCQAQTLTLSPGPVGLWRAEGNALDSVGGNHGTLANGAGFGLRGSEQAFSFNGNSQYMTVPNAPALNFTTALTLAGWFNANSFSGRDAIVLAAKDDAFMDREYQLGLYSPNGTDYYFRAHVGVPSGFMHFAGSTRMEAGQWYHAAMTYDGSALTLYVNGNSDGSLPVSGLIQSGTAPFTVGGLDYGLWFFNGLIDEVALFDRALSQAEIQELMVPEPAGLSLCLVFGAMLLWRRNVLVS